MNTNDFFDEDFEYGIEDDGSQSRKSIKPKRKEGEDWEPEPEENKREKNRSRRRDIEDKLERKNLRKSAYCDYEDYDF